MLIADPARLKPPLESVAAFRCDPDNLAAKLCASYVDQFSAPGPTRLGAIELPNGAAVGVAIHDHGRFGEILAQLSTDIERTLLETFRSLDVSVSDIQWIREGIDQSAILAVLRSSSHDGAKIRQLRVELAPEFQASAGEMLLTSPESHALMLLILQASREPELAAVIGDTGIRMMRVPHTVMADGTEVAPLAIFYRIAPDDSGVAILDVQRLGASDVFIGERCFPEVLDRVMNNGPEAGGEIHSDRQGAARVLSRRPSTVASTVLDVDEILRRAS